jgi:hypothetical protein
VRVEHAPGAGAEYLWGDRRLRFVRCARCGCVTHWERARGALASRMGVNARLFEPEALGEVRIRRLDGARRGGTWIEEGGVPDPDGRHRPLLGQAALTG